ncbi:MAG: hypothetical protein ACP5M4_13260 [Acidobacteriaceae bacterium]
MKKHLAALFACAFILLIPSSPVLAQQSQAKSTTGFHFRFIGPAIGNRVSAFAGIPGNSTTYYAGAASGGIFKSTDAGNDWTPIFDHESAAAIGSIAIAPSDPNVIWVGTGDPFPIRDMSVPGNGVYKSTDAGKTWQHMGLVKTGRIAKVLIDPRNPNDVYVCAEGRITGPQQNRGVFRSTDGGKSWTRILFVNENTGCSSLTFDPNNPRTLFAGTWQVVMHTWAQFSGGPGSGIYVSHDSGVTWQRITGHGLPHSPIGKVSVAVAPTDSSRVYALIETDGQGSFWRSNDGGENWQRTTYNRTLIGRAPYYGTIAVSPTNEDEILVANSSLSISRDGGYTFKATTWGGDNHGIWWDPKNPNHFAITFDEGIDLTTTGGRGMRYITLPVGQMYHVAVDDQIPYRVYTNMQDATTMRFPSIPVSDTDPHAGSNYGMGGCESGFTLPDPSDPNIVWATCYGNEVTRWNALTNTARSVSPWRHTLDAAPDQVKYRCHWTAPLAIDPFHNNTVYYGCQVIFKTTNGGQSWSVISPDLSTHNPRYIVSSGGLMPDNLGQFYGEVVFAIAPSTVKQGLIWAGTNDGKLWYTADGGQRWHDVSANMHIPAWGEITSIQPSFFHPGTAYVSVDYHLMDNRDPYILKTTDYGTTFTRIDSTLPHGPLAWVRNVSEDPNQPGLLFAGTGNALYYSLNRGDKWTRLRANLPSSPVTWTIVQKRFHDLVVSTYGRGIYILDDISPLEQLARAQSTAPVRFFTPRPTYRIPHFENVYFTFALKSAPKKPVTLTITDASGKLVRTLTATAHAGLNRLPWNMHYTAPHQVKLRNAPPQDPQLFMEPRFRGKSWLPITHWGMWQLPTPMAVPGKYAAKLTVDGQSYTAPVTILLDPNFHSTQADLEASVKLQERIIGDVNHVSAMINQLEWMRKQLAVVESMLKSHGNKTLLASAQNMNADLQMVEYQMISKDLTIDDDKTFMSAYKIYYGLLWLNAEVGSGAGDVAGGAPYAPTDTQYTLTNHFEQKLAAATTAYNHLMKTEVPAFNHTLVQHNVTPLVATPHQSHP